MPGAAWPSSLYNASEKSLLDANLAPLNDSLDESWQALQREASGLVSDVASQARQAASRLPDPSTLFGAPAVDAAAPTPAAAAPAGTSWTLPHPSTWFGGGQPDNTSATSPAPGISPTRPVAAASGAPVGMPQASAEPSSQPAGDVDNSSRESFIRTAYPYALQAAGGNADRANQQLAMAISENGDIGTGKDLSLMGFNFSGVHACYDAMTDVLTANGWKSWSDAIPGDIFATIRPQTGALEYQRASRLVRYWHTGEMYRVNTEGVDLLVTPAHRMWVRPSPGVPFQLMTAREISGQRVEYMAPPFAVNDLGDSAETHAELTAGSGVRHATSNQPVDLSDIRFGQFCVRVPFAVRLARLRHHVGHVVGLRALKQVVRPHARRGVAAVADLLFWRQRYPVRTLERVPMRVDARSGARGVELAVTLPVKAGRPDPARPDLRTNDWPVLVDFRPEALVARAEVGAPAGSATVASVALLDDNRVCEEVDPTRLADSRSGTLLGHRDLLTLGRGVWPGRVLDGSGHRANYTASGSWVPFSGMVYCATVPNGLLVVRRNGKIIVSGNSPGESSFMSTDAGRPQAFRAYANPAEGLNGFFSFLQNNPRYAPALARYQQTGDIDELTAAANAAGYSETPGWQDNIRAIRTSQVEPITSGLSSSAQRPAAASQAPQSAPVASQTPPSGWEVDQAALDDPDKWALCGPVAAVMAATKRGGQWTVQQAKQIASASGLWNADQGMGGLSTEVSLLNKMGVSARVGAPDQQQLAADAQAGNTPIISTSRHYFILKGYDPATGKFDTTTSGAVLKGGSRYLTLDEIASLGGGIQGAAYMDNPTTSAPSAVAPPTAGASPSAPAAPSSAPAAAAPTPPSAAGDSAPTTYGASGDTPQASAQPQPDQLRAALNAPSAAPLSLKQPTQGDTLTGADHPAPTSSYNDPTDTGTLSQPLPPQDAAPASYGASGDEPQTPAYQPQPYQAVQDTGANDYPPDQYQQVPIARPAVAQGPQIVQQGMPGVPFKEGFTPILDAGHKVVAWIQDTAQQAASSFADPTVGQVTSTPGEPDYVRPRPRGVIQQATDWATDKLSTPVQVPDQQPRLAYTPEDISDEEAANRASVAGLQTGQHLATPIQPGGAAPPTEDTTAGADFQQVPALAMESTREVVKSALDDFAASGRSYQDGHPLTAAYHAAVGALNAAGLPYTVAQQVANEMLPIANTPVGTVGIGDVVVTAQIAHDIAAIVAAGIPVTRSIYQALRSGTAVEQIIAGASRGLNRAADTIDSGLGAARGIGARLGEDTGRLRTGIRGALDANAEQVAAPGEMQLGSGFVPQGGEAALPRLPGSADLPGVGLRPTDPRRGGIAVPDAGYAPGTPEATVEDALRRAALEQGTSRPSLSSEQMSQLTPEMPNPNAAPSIPAVDKNGVPKVDKKTGKPTMTQTWMGRPPALEDLRQAIEVGLPHRQWYSQFGQWARDLVGEHNMNEFRTIFGITSSRTPVDNNLTNTLAVMRIARDLEARGELTNPAAWREAISRERYPAYDPATGTQKIGADGQPQFNKLPITGQMINKFVDGYGSGVVTNASNAKTAAYSGNVLSGALATYDPNVTVDTWMGQLLGWHTDRFANDDAAYRAAHSIFNWLAREQGLNPHEAQAAGWFTLKTLSEQAPDLRKALDAGRMTLGQAIEAGTKRGIFSNVTGDLAETLGRPAIQDQVVKLAGVIDPKHPGPGSAGSMNMIYPGDKVKTLPYSYRPVSNATVARGQALAEAQAPTVLAPTTAASLGSENGRLPYLDVPHRVLPHGDTASVSLPGGNAETARYAAAVIGQQSGADSVLVHAPSSQAPNVGGVRFSSGGEPMAVELITAITRRLDQAGVPYVVGPRGEYVAAVADGTVTRDALYNGVRSVHGLGIRDLETGAYRGDVERLQRADYGGVVGELGDRFGSRGRPNLPGSSVGDSVSASSADSGASRPPQGSASALGSGAVPRLSPGVRAAAFNAAQGGAIGAVGADQQDQQEGVAPNYGRRAAYALGGAALGVAAGDRGARELVGHALGSGFVSRAANIEARLTEATSRLAEVGQRLEQADAAAQAAERSGSRADVMTANRAYSAVRREYDAAAQTMAAVRDQHRAIGGRMDAAGFGQPMADAGIGTTATPVETAGAGTVPRTVDDTPRTVSLGSGFVPQEPGHYDPRLAQQPALEGMEPPNRPPGDAGPPISEQPNRPRVLGDLPPSQVGEPTLSGMEGPRRPYEQVGPLGQSDVPSGPRSLEDVMANQGVRQGALPGVTPPGSRVEPPLKEPGGTPAPGRNVPVSLEGAIARGEQGQARQPVLPGAEESAAPRLAAHVANVLGPTASEQAQQAFADQMTAKYGRGWSQPGRMTPGEEAHLNALDAARVAESATPDQTPRLVGSQQPTLPTVPEPGATNAVHEPPIAIPPERVAAESARGPRMGQMLNRPITPEPSSVPRGPRLATATTDVNAAARWTENMLYDTAVTPRPGEGSMERPTNLARVNAGSVADQRVERELAPAVESAARNGLQDELPQYLKDQFDSDRLNGAYSVAKQAALDALKTPAQAEADGQRALRQAERSVGRRLSDVKAQLAGQAERVDAAGKTNVLQSSAQAVWDNSQRTLAEARDAGTLSQADLDHMQQYPHWTPGTPISDLLPEGRSGPAFLNDVANAGKGEPVNPLVAARNATIVAQEANQQNYVAQQALRIYDDAHTLGGGVATGPAGERVLLGGDTPLTAHIDGEAETILVPRSVAEGLTAVTQAGAPAGLVGRTWQMLMGLQSRSLTSLRLSFASKNLLRDYDSYIMNTTAIEGAQSALPIFGEWMKQAGGASADIMRAQMNARGSIGAALGFTAGASAGDENTSPQQRLLQGLAAAPLGALYLGANKVKTTGQAAEFLARGGGTGFVRSGLGAGEQWLRETIRDGGVPIRSAKDFDGFLRDWGKDIFNLQGVSAVNERNELIAKTAAMNRADLRGESAGQAMLRGRDVTYDPETVGTMIRQGNRVVQFLGAMSQGAAQEARLWVGKSGTPAERLTQHFLPTLASTTLVLAPFVLAAEAWNRSDPNRAAAYDNVSQFAKDSGIVWMMPWAGGSDVRGNLPQYIVIPTEISTPMVVGMRGMLENVDHIVPGLSPNSGRSDYPANATEPEKWAAVLNETLSVFHPLRGDSPGAVAASMVPAILREPVGQYFNKDFSSGGDINDQSGYANAHATTLSRRLAQGANTAGQFLNANTPLKPFGDFLQSVQPANIEHAIKGALPAYGDIATGASDVVAPGPYKRAELGRAANIPFAGGVLSSVIKDAGGANLERAQSQAMTPDVQGALRDANLPPGAVDLTVPSMYKGGTLNRDEQVAWQEQFNDVLDTLIGRVASNPKWRNPTTQKQALDEVVTRAKDIAATRARLPSDTEMQRRAREEQARQNALR